MNDELWMVIDTITDSKQRARRGNLSPNLSPKMEKKDSKNHSNSTYTNGVVYPAISPCSASSFFVYVIYISFLVEFGDTRAG